MATPTTADYEVWKAQNPDADPALFFLEQDLAQEQGMTMLPEEGPVSAAPVYRPEEDEFIAQQEAAAAAAEELRGQQPLLTPKEALHYAQTTRLPEAGAVPTAREIAEGDIPLGTPAQREFFEKQKAQREAAEDVAAFEAAREAEDTVAGVKRLRPPAGVGGPGMPLTQTAGLGPGPVRVPGYVPDYERQLKGILAPYTQPKEFEGAQDIETLQKEMDHLRNQPKTIATADRMAQIGNQIKTIIETEEATVKQQVMEQQADALNKWKSEQKKIQGEATKQLKGLKESYDKAATDYQTAEIDPQRWQKQHSKVAQALVIALGGLGAAFTRASGRNAQNEAVSMINRFVDQDIQAQQQELRKKGQNVNIQQNRLAFYKNLLKDEEAAHYAAKAELLEDSKRQLAMKTVEFGSKIAQQNAAAVDAQLSRQSLESKQNALQRLQAMSIQRAQLNMQRSAMAAKMQQAKMQNRYQVPPGLKLVAPDRYIPTEEDAKISKDLIGTATSYMDALDKVIAFQEEHGAEVGWDRKTVNKGKQLINEAVIAGKLDKDMGAHFTPMEMKLLGLGEDPTELGANWFGGLRARLKVARRSVMDQTNLRLKPYGYKLDLTERLKRQ